MKTSMDRALPHFADPLAFAGGPWAVPTAAPGATR